MLCTGNSAAPLWCCSLVLLFSVTFQWYSAVVFRCYFLVLLFSGTPLSTFIVAQSVTFQCCFLVLLFSVIFKWYFSVLLFSGTLLSPFSVDFLCYFSMLLFGVTFQCYFPVVLFSVTFQWYSAVLFQQISTSSVSSLELEGQNFEQTLWKIYLTIQFSTRKLKCKILQPTI